MAPTSTPAPRLFRFRLRTLLVAVTILCVAIAIWLQRAEKQRKAVAALKARGARVYYNYEWQGDRYLQGAEPRLPGWLLKRCGVDMFYPAVAVEMGAYFQLDIYDQFPGQSTYDPDFLIDEPTWQNLQALPLEWLGLNACNLSNDDLRQVARIRGLRFLTLETVPIDGRGLRHLAALPRLEEICAHHCGITDDTLDGLLELRSLRVLGLQETRLTDAGLKRVHEALPDCQIYD